MFKDFLSWTDGKSVVVSDLENQRYFSRPLTIRELTYIIAYDLQTELQKKWTPARKALEGKKFRAWMDRI